MLATVSALWPDAGVMSLFVTLRVTLTGYFRIDDDSIFEFSPSTTVPGQGPILFTDAVPLDVELEWRPELAQAWLRGLAEHFGVALGELDVERVLERFASDVLGADPVRAGDFRWRRVLQARPSTPGSTIKAGLRSIWT